MPVERPENDGGLLYLDGGYAEQRRERRADGRCIKPVGMAQHPLRTDARLGVDDARHGLQGDAGQGRHVDHSRTAFRLVGI